MAQAATPAPASADPLLTVAQVAELASVHVETVRNWARNGDLRDVRLGHRTVRYRASAVDECLARLDSRSRVAR